MSIKKISLAVVAISSVLYFSLAFATDLAVCFHNGGAYTTSYSGEYWRLVDGVETYSTFSSGRLLGGQGYKVNIGPEYSGQLVGVTVQYWNGSKWKMMYQGSQLPSSTIKADGNLIGGPKLLFTYGDCTY